MAIYALRVASDWNDRIFDSLKRGEGRFGWSTADNADLRELNRRIEEDGWDSLNEDEQNWYRHQEFLLRLEKGDYIVYINLPSWGQCTLAGVTGKYYWYGSDDDFNHRFPVCSESIREFNRNDARVMPALSARLKLQGRWWTIYAEEEFRRLLEALESKAPAPKTPETNLRYLSEEIRPLLDVVSNKITRTHPNRDLEFLVEKLLLNVPGVKNVKRQGGAGDHGADLIVNFEFGSIPGLVHRDTLVVQVKSYEGKIRDMRAVHDIERAFERYKHATQGLIISTAASLSEELQRNLEELQERSGKPVALLTGAEFAAFFFKFGGNLLNISAQIE